MNEQTKQFIQSHLNDDVRKLALSKVPDGVNLRFVLEQIDGRQRAKAKLPSLAANPDIIFPVHLSVEQCSSEATAAYKAQVLTPSNSPTRGGQNPAEGNSSPVGRSGGVLIDLTGGFGIDFIALSKLFDKAIYVERNADLCAIAEQNFRTLNLANTHIINSEAEDFFSLDPPTPRGGNFKSALTDEFPVNKTNKDLPLGGIEGVGGLLFFADPARRSESGSRTYAISDCTPDILQLIPVLKKGGALFLKLSPMLDWHKAVEDIQAQGVNVSEVHIVSVKNECKELLILVDLQTEPQQEFKLFCTDLPADLPPTPSFQDGGKYASSLEIPYPVKLFPPRPERKGLGEGQNGVGGGLLLLPNASVMKAGCWDFLVERFGVTQADKNSHIFFSDHEVPDFPGKQYRIKTICSMNKKELRKAMEGISYANIAVRNFPLSADALRKRLKLKDGGTTYIFGTTIQGEHKIIVCE